MHFDEYTGKTIFVTGAASGIGQAQAVAFTAQGANVLGFDLDPTGLTETEKRVPKQQVPLSAILAMLHKRMRFLQQSNMRMNALVLSIFC